MDLTLSFLALSICLTSLVLALAVPNDICASLGSTHAIQNTGCRTKPLNDTLLETHGASFHLAAPPSPTLPDPFSYRIRTSSKSIIYRQLGAELPSFDDVISTLDSAEAEIEREASMHRPIIQQRTWSFGTARLVMKPIARDTMNQAQLLQYLWGLREMGFQYGFWESRLVFFDSAYGMRATGVLESRELSDEA